MKSVICVGHSALDRVFTVDSWPQGSAKLVASGFAEIGGGMAANAAVAILNDARGERLVVGYRGSAPAGTCSARLE